MTKTTEEAFRENFVRGHPGDSGVGGNTPQDPETWVEADPEELLQFIKARENLVREEAYTAGLIVGVDKTGKALNGSAHRAFTCISGKVKMDIIEEYNNGKNK